MTQIATPFGSSAGRYNFAGSMSLENCHLEAQDDSGKGKLVIVPSDGAIEFAEPTDSPCRGMIYLEDLDLIYSAHESSGYKTNSAGTSTRVGTIPGIDTVQITRNNKETPQITVLAESSLWVIESDAVNLINDADMPSGKVSVETLGEYTLIGIDDGRVFYSTQGETTQYSALDFFTAEQSSDKLIRLKADRGELFVFNQRTIENFNFTGNIDSPFEFRTVIPRGLLAKNSVVACDMTLMFIGDDGIVYRLEGFSPKRISNHEIERLIQGDASQADIRAWTYSRGGHTFYVLKGTNWTRAYDAATGFWHKRKSNALDVWRAQHSVQAWGKTILGDQSTGKLLYLNENTYTEDGDPMAWEVITPFMMAGPKGGIVDRLWIDFLTGQGVLASTATGFDPLLMLSYSDDGGNTWSFPRNLNCGRRGDYRKRVETWRLGKFDDKGRVWKLRMTDPVGRALTTLDAKVRPIAA